MIVGTVVAIEDVAEGINPLIELMDLAATVDASDDENNVACSERFVERLNAIVACRSRCYMNHILASR